MKNKKIKLIIFCIITALFSLLTCNVSLADSIEEIKIDLDNDKESDEDDCYISINHLTMSDTGEKPLKTCEYINGRLYVMFTVDIDGKYEIDLSAMNAREGEIQIFNDNPNDDMDVVRGSENIFALSQGVTYACEIFSNMRVGETVNFKYTNTTAAPEALDTPQNPEETVSGELGSENNPYLVNRDTQIKYETLPFYFRLDYLNADGQYEIKQDVEKKTVTFKYVSNDVDVGYYDSSSMSETDSNYVPSYVQAGANGIRLEKRGAYPKYAIKTFESCLSMPNNIPNSNGQERTYLLNNAMIKGENIVGRNTANTVYVLVSTGKSFNSSYPRYSYYNTNIVGILYSFNGAYDAFEDDSQATGLQALIARILTGIGDKYVELLRFIVGTNCTIDSIIFNDFEPTRLDFFESGTVASTVKNVVNTWFRLFTNMAYVIYFIFLVYVGIQVILNSGKKAYREYIDSWVIGLLLLAIMPMCLGYVFKVNDTFVAMIGNGREKTYSMINYNTDLDINGTAGEDSKTSTVEDLVARKTQVQSDILQELQDNMMADIPGSIRNLRVHAEDYVKTGYTRSELQQAIDEFSDWVFLYAKIEDFTPERIQSEKNYLSKMVDETKFNVGTAIDNYIEMVIRYKELVEERQNIEEQIVAATSGTDLMGDMRVRAGKTYRIAYALVYLFMLFQVTFLLILYYKRIFVIAMLIIIFPLVMATYVKDKTSDGKADILTTWWKEFFANVFVQMIHAVIYVVIIEAGLNIYKADQNNWLVFLLAILFLFPAESILRSILGLQSSTLVSLKGTIGRAAAGIGAGVAVARSLGNGKSKAEQEAEQKKKKAEEERKKKKVEKKNQKKDIATKRRTASSARAQTTTGAQRKYYEAKSAMLKGKDKLSEKASKVKKKISASKIGKIAKGTYKVAKVSAKVSAKATKGIVKTGRRVAGAATGFAAALAGGGSPSDFIAGSATGAAIGGVTGKWKNYDPEDNKYTTRSARKREKVQKALNERNASQNTSSSGTSYNNSSSYSSAYTSSGEATYTGNSGGEGNPRVRLNVTQGDVNLNENRRDER